MVAVRLDSFTFSRTWKRFFRKRWHLNLSLRRDAARWIVTCSKTSAWKAIRHVLDVGWSVFVSSRHFVKITFDKFVACSSDSWLRSLCEVIKPSMKSTKRWNRRKPFKFVHELQFDGVHWVACRDDIFTRRSLWWAQRRGKAIKKWFHKKCNSPKWKQHKSLTIFQIDSCQSGHDEHSSRSLAVFVRSSKIYDSRQNVQVK